MIAIKQDYWKNGAIDAYMSGEIPVLIAKTGRYPVALIDDQSTDQCPHILIVMGDDGAAVYAVGRFSKNGYRQQILVASSPDGVDALVWAKEQVADAAKTLASLDDIYQEALEFSRRAHQYQYPLTRADYEAACLTLGVTALSDREVDSYGVRYGDFRFPEYSSQHCASMWLARQRLTTIDQGKPVTPPVSPVGIPIKEGQLWEPCPKCGNEPVWMPLNVCERCWPKDAAE